MTTEFRISIVPQGEWNSTTTYERLDLVKFEGGSYLAKNSNIDKLPSSNPAFWFQIAEKGAQGEQGRSGDPAPEEQITPAVSNWLENNLKLLTSILLIPNYDSSEIYQPNNVILYANKIYICRKTTTAGTLPTNTEYWSEVVISSIIDDTLSIPGAAADAAAAGAGASIARALAGVIRDNNLEYFAGIAGKYVKANGDVDTLSSLRCSDFITVPDNASKLQLYVFYTNVNTGQKNTFNPVAVLYNAAKGVIGTVSPSGHVNGVKTQSIDPSSIKYIRVNQSNRAPDKADCLVRFLYADDVGSVIEGALGTVGSFSDTFTAAEQVLQTGVDLQAGKTYVVRSTAPLEEAVSLYAFNDASHAVTLTPSADAVRLTPAASAPLCVTNPDGGLFSVALTVSAFASIADKTGEVPKIYRVNKTAGAGDYTSLTQCLLDLKDDRSPKTIYIDGGDYDIFEEYQNAGVQVYTGSNPALDYWDYNVWIPDNTHIIGRGIVRLMWMPDPAEHPELTTVQCQTVSPVNAAGSMTLENVEIHCKNGRYCIHDDPLGKTQYNGAVKIYKNVRCFHYANDRTGGVAYGFAPTIGMGLDKQMHYEFENCYFWNGGQSYAFYCHSRQMVDGQRLTEAESSDLTLKNCVCKTARAQAVKFGNSGGSTNLRIRVNLYNCWLQGSIDIINESSNTTSTDPNAFDLLIVDSIVSDINVADINNKYPPKFYGLRLPLNILTQPENVEVNAGASYSISILVNTSNVSYDWQYYYNNQWTSFVDGNAATLTKTAQTSQNGWKIRCKVTGADGTILFSNVVKLTVSS